MVGDNDAGAFGTYTQAGQNYGTTLLWTLLLLIPVLYVNQEMALRLGAVSGVGHARLILERFGKFWGSFSVIDLVLLNALTIVTEFIGISLALGYLGLPKTFGVLASAALVMIAVSTGNFRRFERFAVVFVFGRLLLVPVVLMVHPPVTQIMHDFSVPKMPQHAPLSEVMLLIIAIVGTTVAPWQLFFQQSHVVDKRITPRFIKYERVDLVIGIGLVIIGAVAMMAFTAAAFAGRPEFGGFTDAGAVAAALEKYAGTLPAVLFAPHLKIGKTPNILPVSSVNRKLSGSRPGWRFETSATRVLVAAITLASSVRTDVSRSTGTPLLSQSIANMSYRTKTNRVGRTVASEDHMSARSVQLTGEPVGV
jgi:Mn2+/Fe2+ NRAMP family transporter